MTANGWLQIGCFTLAVLLVTRPLGLYLVAVYQGRVRWLAPVERLLYRLAGVNPDEDQRWTRYAGAMLLFSAASMLLTYYGATAPASTCGCTWPSSARSSRPTRRVPACC